MAVHRCPDEKAYLRALCRAVPRAVAERLLDDPTEATLPPWEETDGSVLNADIVGFTPLCEELAQRGASGLSRLTETLDTLFQGLLDDALLPYGGDVLLFGGDSLTAVFRGEGHERRAAASALLAQRLMRERLSALLASEGRPLTLRLGLAAGPVRLIVVGDTLRRQMTASGETAHRAMHLQRLAEPGCVQIDERLLQRLGPDASAERRDDGSAILRALANAPAPAPPPEIDERALERPTSKIRVLERFVPEPLAARMRSAPVGGRLDGELRRAVVLFAELNGLDSTRRGFELTLGMARAVLRLFRKYDGLVAKADLAEKGHRMLVLFGLHRPAGNDAERALLAALEATSLRPPGADAEAAGDGFSIQVGIHTGLVYSGSFGSDRRQDITVVSDAVNTAARLASLAQPFEVLASDDALRAAGGEFRSSPRPPISVKGKIQPVTYHSIQSPAERHAHYLRVRKSKREHVGRDLVIAQLRQIARRARQGEGVALGICGETGMGKSALLTYLVDGWVGRGGAGLISRCRYATRGAPLAPLASMFATFLGLTSQDDPAARAERIRAGLAPFQIEEGGEELVALLQSTMRGQGMGGVPLDLADPYAHERLLSAILRFAEQRLEREPMLYVVEDLHLADSLTLEVAIRSAALAKRGRSLFVLTYPPEASVEVLRRVLDVEIVLSPLDRAAVSTLACRELAAQEVEPRLLDFLLARSQGNPGCLLEVTRFLKERGLATVRAGLAHTPQADLAVLHEIVPSSLGQVALARMDDLGEVERRLLRTASAIGQRFPRELLERASGDVEPPVIFVAMKNLEGERVIEPEEDDTSRWAFRDEITRSVAYASIPESARRDVHRRIADAVEQLPPDDPARTPAALAIHRERAGDFAAAANWYERAARLALGSGLDEETSEFLERWRRCVDALPAEQRPDKAHAAKLALLRLVAAGRRLLPAETMRLSHALVHDYWPLLDAESHCLVDRWLGEALLWHGRTTKALERLERAHAAATEESTRAEAALLAARAFERTGQRDRAEEWLARAEVQLASDPYRRDRAALLRADLRLQAGELPGAVEILSRVQRSAREKRQLRLEAAATAGLARAAMHGRRFDEAESGFREAMGLFRAVSSWGEAARCLVNRGQTRLWAGQAHEARAYLEEAIPLAGEVEDEMALAEARVHLGAAIAATEDPDAGAQLLEEGATRAEQAGWVEPAEAARLHRLRLATALPDVQASRRLAEALARLPCPLPTPLFTTTREELLARLLR